MEDNKELKLELAKFQVRIGYDINEALENFANAIGNSKNNCVEAALFFCMNNEITRFTKFADDYLNGMFLIVKNGRPVANVVRRNIISYKQISDDKMQIVLKVKDQNNMWSETTISFDLNENPHILEHIESWDIE